MTINSPQLARTIKKLNLPAVDLQDTHKLANVPRVYSDQREIVRMAAEHLLECGFQKFAYCGLSGDHYSENQRELFVETLTNLGHEVEVFEGLHLPSMIDRRILETKYRLDRGKLTTWVKSLPKPVGIMTCNDTRAAQLLNVCAEQSIAVPDEVAVIGVDNDEVVCGLCRPQLSSVQSNAHQIGFVAAEILHKMISGDSSPECLTLIKPLRVVRRRSSDVLAIADKDVAAAIRFICEHSSNGISVEDVVAAVRLSRVTLERKFKKVLGQTPKEKISLVQIQNVMDLLSTTEHPLAIIADLTGFNHLETMCNVFKRKTGRTPGEYRRESRV